MKIILFKKYIIIILLISIIANVLAFLSTFVLTRVYMEKSLFLTGLSDCFDFICGNVVAIFVFFDRKQFNIPCKILIILIVIISLEPVKGTILLWIANIVYEKIKNRELDNV
ncbi:MAG: hypothetical protein ABI199_01235 [Bacteroidia bacterium]